MSSEKVKEPSNQPSAPTYPIDNTYPVQLTSDGNLYF